MEIRKRASRTNKKHQSYMVDFLETHPEMVNANFSQPMARQHYNKLWQELCMNLNAMGLGEKTVTQWQKTFGDWCTKTKGKISVSTGHMNKTGGGPNLGIELSDLEIRLMALKGWSCVYGDNQTEDAGFGELPGNNMAGIENEYNTSDLIEFGANVTPAIKNTASNTLQTRSLHSEFMVTQPILLKPSTSTGPKITAATEPNSQQEASVYKDFITTHSIIPTTPTSTKLQITTSTKNKEANTQQRSALYTHSAAQQTPSKKIDMETMHYQTLSVLKEINQNLKEMNNGMLGIKDALNEQVSVFKTLRDLVAHNEN